MTEAEVDAHLAAMMRRFFASDEYTCWGVGPGGTHRFVTIDGSLEDVTEEELAALESIADGQHWWERSR